MSNPQRQHGIDVTLEVFWDRLSARFGEVDCGHAEHEAVKMTSAVGAQVNLKDKVYQQFFSKSSNKGKLTWCS